MDAIQQQISSTSPNQLLGMGILAGFAILYFSLAWNKSHTGRHGAPCYCKSCEQVLTEAANNGDVTAQRKLKLIKDAGVSGGVYTGTGSKQLGTPVNMFIGLLFIIVVLNVVFKLRQSIPTTPQSQQFFAGQGRVPSF